MILPLHTGGRRLPNCKAGHVTSLERPKLKCEATCVFQNINARLCLPSLLKVCTLVQKLKGSNFFLGPIKVHRPAREIYHCRGIPG